MITTRMSEIERIELYYAAARDQGDRSMRENNRGHWNQEDFEVAVRELNRLYPATTEEDTTP